MGSPISIFSTEEFAQKSDDPPVVRLVNKILHHAIQQEASDIHFEPFEKNYRIRLRVDGILHEIESLPLHFATRLTSRLKIMSELDISERRLPQDGRFKMTLSENQAIEFRVSSCPTLFGEKIVMRLVNSSKNPMSIDELGFDEDQKIAFLKALHEPQGMILVTGPTGSGKTNSLYTALSLLNATEVNISTVEDPIERYLPGINQVNIHSKAGLTFATTLRAFLRQDPDIIMVGEIRDLETAEIAMHAAQTGHMVLSTLHSNSAAQTLNRLVNMGIPAFQVATTLSLILAQRLARRLCQYCKEVATYTTKFLLSVGFNEHDLQNMILHRSKGCSYCLEGFKGRIGLYEVMPLALSIKEKIIGGGSALEILQEMKKMGITCLRQAGLQKVKMGLTCLEEVIRITKDE